MFKIPGKEKTETEAKKKNPIQSASTTTEKPSTLLQTKVEKTEKTVKNAGEILTNFRITANNTNILTCEMSEDILLL